MSDIEKKINDWANAHGVTVKAKFVPYTEAVKDEAFFTPKDRPAFNWLVSVTKNGSPLCRVPYTAGIGHSPTPEVRSPRTARDVAKAVYEVETGYVWADADATVFGAGTKKKVQPKAADILACVVRESHDFEVGTFEEWAELVGENPDSRAAEKTYNRARTLLAGFREGLGDEAFDALYALACDY